MKATYDVIVVGAGIVGAACARACACAGLQVLVLERDGIAGGATGAGMGHVVVMDDSPAQFALTAYSRQLWHEAIPCMPPATEVDVCGTLWVAADEEEMREVRRKQATYAEYGIATHCLDPTALRREEPHLRTDLVGGLCVPDDLVVYPPVATAFLLDEAQCHRAELRTRTPVQALLPGGGVRLANGSEVYGGAVVNATGCDAPALTPALEVRRRKGHLAITERIPRFARHQIIELGYLKSAHTLSTESVAFNLQPRKSGQLLIGSSRQFDASQPEVQFDLLRRMLDRAQSYMPALDKLTVLRCWTGFRPATPDKLPTIGPHPRQERVWLATGHEGLGITTSLATGRILADLLLNRTPAIPVAPYLPARLWQQESSHV